jgi:hypothetical protein
MSAISESPDVALLTPNRSIGAIGRHKKARVDEERRCHCVSFRVCGGIGRSNHPKVTTEK